MAASFTQHPYCAMCDANSSLLDFVSTSLVYAPLHLHFCAMSNTYSSLHRAFGTPLKAASLLLSAVCNAHSSLLRLIGTSPMATIFYLHFCAMSNTYSSLRRDFGTPLKAASLLLSAMCNAHSSLLRLIGTSPMATMFYSLHFSAMRDTYSSLSSGVFGTLLLDAFFSSPYA